MERVDSLSGSGLKGLGGKLHRPPPPPMLVHSLTALPSAAEPGAARSISYVPSAISRALTASWAPLPPPPPHLRCKGEGRGGGGGQHDGEDNSLRPPPTLPTFAPT